MKSKKQKRDALVRLRGQFDACPAVIVCKFGGLTVAEDQVLRGALRELGGRYQVVANRLACLAARDTPFESTLEGQRGMTALAFPGEDVVASLKALVTYARDHDNFKFTAGVVEGRALDIDQLNSLARLPGKEGIQAQLLYMINSSAQRLMSVINAPGRDIAAAMQQGVEKERFAA